MKIRTMLVIALAMSATVGCKKQEKERQSMKPREGEGTAPIVKEPVTPAPAPTPAPKSGQELASLYSRCVGHVNAGKLDQLKQDCVASDITIHQMDGKELKGNDALVGMLTEMRSAMPDVQLEPQLVIVSGRNIIAVTLTRGKHTGPMKKPDGSELAPTGKQVGHLFLHRLAINDENKATEEWAYSDPATMMGQLGVLPAEVHPTRRAIEKGWEGAPIVVISADDAKERSNLELAKKAVDAFNSHKLPDVMALWADDSIESDQAEAIDQKGKKAIEQGHRLLFTAFPDVKAEVPHWFAAGDYVVALGSFTGTHKGQFGSIKPTNKQVTGTYADVFKLEDGKIVELWRFRNGMALATQLGVKVEGKGVEPAKVEPAKVEPTKEPATP